MTQFLTNENYIDFKVHFINCITVQKADSEQDDRIDHTFLRNIGQYTLKHRSLTLNGPCSYGSDGICITTSSCTAAGGTYKSNFCPKDPANVKCCEKSCSSGGKYGTCKFTNKCAGIVVSNLCPGGTEFKCCIPDSSFGSGCLFDFAKSSAETIIANNKGCVGSFTTYRSTDPKSDHTYCKAVDIWPVKNKAACVTTVAEYVMNNQVALKLKYVIYGQKIWNPLLDAIKPWNNWRLMEDRGSDTENHWDHIHVSFN